jgi:hypothetical protein
MKQRPGGLDIKIFFVTSLYELIGFDLIGDVLPYIVVTHRQYSLTIFYKHDLFIFNNCYTY